MDSPPHIQRKRECSEAARATITMPAVNQGSHILKQKLLFLFCHLLAPPKALALLTSYTRK